MTTEQRKQYEEAANEYANKFADTESEPVSHGIFKKHYLAGCEYAHSKIEEAERDAWNRAIDEASMLCLKCDGDFYTVMEELKKLRK